MSNASSEAGRWPVRLPVGSFRVMRPSVHYDQTIRFYGDLVGLPVLETFQESYGEDSTIFGLPDSVTHLEIVRVGSRLGRSASTTSWCSTLPTNTPSRQ